MNMVDASSNVFTQMQSSLQDLSMELTLLGLEPLSKNDCSKPTEVCETLLNAAWSLINLAHCNALGLNEKSVMSDREIELHNEKQSVESQLTRLQKEVALKNKALACERGNVKRIERELLLQSEKFQKQKSMISHLLKKLEEKEKNFQHDVARQEVQCEHLREMVRKSLGVGVKHNSSATEKLGDSLRVLAVSEAMSLSEHDDLQQATLNRLKSTNQTLVSENLMLRSALRMVHVDIHQLLESARKTLSNAAEFQEQPMPESIFGLPLSYCRNKLQEIRQKQIIELYEVCKKLIE